MGLVWILLDVLSLQPCNYMVQISDLWFMATSIAWSMLLPIFEMLFDGERLKLYEL